MAAIEFLCKDIGVDPRNFSKEELLFLEAELFFHVCNELKLLFKENYRNYFRLLRINPEVEEEMIESNFLRYVISDILSTEAYTLSGIALYARVPEEVVYELISGNNTNPSLSLARKIIELHKSVRPDVYRKILLKVVKESQLLK
ncbi:MAG: hypothetical protein EPO11_04720 [Gammaproteobacteria bacterium]|nr:MAG: hypothetical protein EPO11_04720 [Gammaproteobacteria bacterium]